MVIFPRTFSKVESMLSQYNEFIIIGTVDISSSQQCKIKADTLLPLQHILTEGIEHVTIELDDGADNSRIDSIKEHLKPGKVQLSLQFAENKKNVLLTPKERYALDTKLLKTLHNLGMTVRLQVKSG